MDYITHFEHLRNFPAIFPEDKNGNKLHESLFKGFQILQEVKRMLKRGDSQETILNLIEDLDPPYFRDGFQYKVYLKDIDRSRYDWRALRSFPQLIQIDSPAPIRIHESITQSWQILQEVKRMLKRRDSQETILNLVEDLGLGEHELRLTEIDSFYDNLIEGLI